MVGQRPWPKPVNLTGGENKLLSYTGTLQGSSSSNTCKERPNIVKRLHESHIGIEGTLRRARDIVYWPGITAQLKDYLSKCGI